MPFSPVADVAALSSARPALSSSAKRTQQEIGPQIEWMTKAKLVTNMATAASEARSLTRYSMSSFPVCSYVSVLFLF
jgi:hypothetical protein